MTMRLQKDAFAERERALEEEFFYRSNNRLLEQLRRSLADQATRGELAAATGISDPELLDELVASNIGPESITALSLAPLVLVAWSDGDVDAKERRTILDAAAERGIDVESIAFRLLEHWLATKPSPRLLQTWKRYTKAICQTISPTVIAVLRDEILRRAKAVAKASGGVLSLGRITREEQKILDAMAQAFATTNGDV